MKAEKLVNRTFFPISLTGSGPLCSSASSTAKSLPHISSFEMLFSA